MNNNDNIYYNIRNILANRPHGFPSTKENIEIRILKKLFTYDQAKLFVKIHKDSIFLTPIKPNDKKLQSKLKLSEKKIFEKLEAMALDGLLIRQKYDEKPDEPFYFIPSFIIGLYEFSIKKIDKDLANLYHQYLEHIAQWMNQAKTKQLRIIPVKNSLTNRNNIHPYNKIDELIKGHYLIAVAPCICAKEKEALGGNCKAPIERCITFDWWAEHYIDTGLGRKISEIELNDILTMAHENGLVISPANMKETIGFCLCCDCCCSWLKILNFDPFPSSQCQTSYTAVINGEKCTHCDICINRCNMKAIDNTNHNYHILNERCIGCGLCVTTCPNQAINLIENNSKISLPKDPTDLFLKIYFEQAKKGNYNKGNIGNFLLLYKVLFIRLLYTIFLYFKDMLKKS